MDSWNSHPRTTRIGVDARAIGRIPICWDRDRDDAIARAHEQFRWFGLGWPVNSELPSPGAFGSATRSVTPDDIAQSVACGPDLDRIVESERVLESGFHRYRARSGSAGGTSNSS